MDAYSRDLEMIEERMKWHRARKAVEWAKREGLIKQGPNPGFWPEYFPEPKRSAWLTWQGEFVDAREAADESGIPYNTIWYQIKKIEKQTGQKFNQPKEKKHNEKP